LSWKIIANSIKEGGIQARSIEDVTRIIALIGIDKCGGSLPSGAHGGGWEGLGLIYPDFEEF